MLTFRCVYPTFSLRTSSIVTGNATLGANHSSITHWALPTLRWSLSEVWLAQEEKWLLQMCYLQLSSVQLTSADGLWSKLCAVIEDGSSWGSALIANKVYLLPTTATSSHQSVFDPCLPSLCGPIMKVRMTVFTLSSTHTNTHNYTVQTTRGLARTLKNTQCHSTYCTLHTVISV